MNEDMNPMGEETLSAKLQAFKKQRLAKEIKRVTPKSKPLVPQAQAFKMKPIELDLGNE